MKKEEMHRLLQMDGRAAFTWRSQTNSHSLGNRIPRVSPAERVADHERIIDAQTQQNKRKNLKRHTHIYTHPSDEGRPIYDLLGIGYFSKYRQRFNNQFVWKSKIFQCCKREIWVPKKDGLRREVWDILILSIIWNCFFAETDLRQQISRGCVPSELTNPFGSQDEDHEPTIAARAEQITDGSINQCTLARQDGREIILSLVPSVPRVRTINQPPVITIFQHINYVYSQDQNPVQK